MANNISNSSKRIPSTNVTPAETDAQELSQGNISTAESVVLRRVLKKDVHLPAVSTLENPNQQEGLDADLDRLYARHSRAYPLDQPSATYDYIERMADKFFSIGKARSEAHGEQDVEAKLWLGAANILAVDLNVQGALYSNLKALISS